MGERRLSEAGRAGEEDVVDGLAPFLRRRDGDGDGECLFNLPLADKLLEVCRPDGGAIRLFVRTSGSTYVPAGTRYRLKYPDLTHFLT